MKTFHKSGNTAYNHNISVLGGNVMEYTKDVVFNVKYKKEKLLEKKEEDYFFILTVLVSIIAIGIDYMLVKEFVNIIL